MRRSILNEGRQPTKSLTHLQKLTLNPSLYAVLLSKLETNQDSHACADEIWSDKQITNFQCELSYRCAPDIKH